MEIQIEVTKWWAALASERDYEREYPGYDGARPYGPSSWKAWLVTAIYIAVVMGTGTALLLRRKLLQFEI